MASKPTAAKTSAVESVNQVNSGENLSAQEVNSTEGVDTDVLEDAIAVLEGKKKTWYAYLLTRDFWFVLALGFVSISPDYQRAVC
jgi:solute carrier family 35, member F1/2